MAVGEGHPLADKALVSDVCSWGYLVIEALYKTSSQEKLNIGYFSVDIKTLQVKLFAGLSKVFLPGELYASFPPSLCAPTI